MSHDSSSGSSARSTALEDASHETATNRASQPATNGGAVQQEHGSTIATNTLSHHVSHAEDSEDEREMQSEMGSPQEWGYIDDRH
ncbi:hypothetical protein AX16_004958 [Volvariella volvacea WC 439]|nr:hypothetical protein AX16_004958 [Volvariella volvacea WC 439]